MDLLSESAAEADRGPTRVTVRSGVTFLVVQTNAVREHLAAIIDQQLKGMEGHTGGRVALCLSEVDDMNSAFINVLIEADRRFRERGGRLVLFGLNPELSRLFRDTGLDKRLSVSADCNRAVKRIKRLESPRRRQLWTWFTRQAA
ncbi:MAG: STAS domain-containing protein [Phycisphaerales bacterium]